MAKGKKRKMAGWEGFVKALLQVAGPGRQPGCFL
jgi:hypothetical protein